MVILHICNIAIDQLDYALQLEMLPSHDQKINK